MTGNSPDKTEVVYMNKRRHEELTVKPVHDAAMTWNGVAKILKQ